MFACSFESNLARCGRFVILAVPRSSHHGRTEHPSVKRELVTGEIPFHSQSRTWGSHFCEFFVLAHPNAPHPRASDRHMAFSLVPPAGRKCLTLSTTN
jgi:hypothetical protein